MKLVLQGAKSYCCLEKFILNSKEAKEQDFGYHEDIHPEQAEPYGCGDMRFIAKLPTQAVLDKYGINADEYAEVCSRLDEELSFGHCGWCI